MRHTRLLNANISGLSTVLAASLAHASGPGLGPIEGATPQPPPKLSQSYDTVHRSLQAALRQSGTKLGSLDEAMTRAESSTIAKKNALAECKTQHRTADCALQKVELDRSQRQGNAQVADAAIKFREDLMPVAASAKATISEQVVKNPVAFQELQRDAIDNSGDRLGAFTRILSSFKSMAEKAHELITNAQTTEAERQRQTLEQLASIQKNLESQTKSATAVAD